MGNQLQVSAKEAALQDIAKESWYEEPLTVFIFGASGDLAKKKTYPALLDLWMDGLLPPQTVICGYARSEKKDADFKKQIMPYLLKKVDKKAAKDFLKICVYRSGQYSDAAALKKHSEEMTKKFHKNPSVENRVFYFALPPNAFIDTAASVKAGGMSPNGFNRLIVEKPFGHDLESAEKMGADLGAIFDESYLYRIDHYLGKEMVQNMMILRFGNSWLEPIWNRNFVKAVVISFKEDIGTMGRGGYFDKSGIIRDIMQNHLMQVLSVIAMEPPERISGPDYSNLVRDKKVALLKCIEPWSMANSVIGQYVSNGSEPGYLEDPTVPKGSNCPTFACTVMKINNDRWQGVPFIMKAGKALNQRRAEVRVQLKSPPNGAAVFNLESEEQIPYNEIVLRLQPEEAIYVKTNVKRPGLATELIQSELDLSYSSRYKDEKNPDAYTRLILDVLRGKQATFVRQDELVEAWKIATPLLKEVEESKVKPTDYVFGTRGPKEADVLIQKAGFVVDKNYKWNKA
uniref:Glucose-6-phosphate 1-dehydrogenase n=1 Tax=Aplanochytrium stocchinoi TaxID=215587 RepID=A0A7S3V057_9STRA|mmetsp:Transcript_137/g.220  ORF Transcript_137/g.220 Transcript_137/m.220 type:complete len:514 (-) Transcript_137:1865-3406(-)